MSVLVGFRRFTSKKGKDCCIATILRDATEREKQYGAIGQVAEDLFLPDSQYNYLTEKSVGKEVKLYWDRAFLEKIEIV